MFCFTPPAVPTCIVHRVSHLPRACRKPSYKYCAADVITKAIGNLSTFFPATPTACTTDAVEAHPTPPTACYATNTSDKSNAVSTSQTMTTIQSNGGVANTDEPTEFVILGSGVSTGLPRISCIIRPTEAYRCAVCHDALHTPGSKNRRGNVSALVRAAGRTVLIDCGKTIRESTMRHFPTLNVRNVDAIVLTHGHADAILGLDDARDIQMAPRRIVVGNEVRYGETPPTPVYLNEATMTVCRNVFPYLMPPDRTDVTPVKRRVSRLDWQVFTEKDYFKPFKPVSDAPIELTPVPMFHGGDYICMGYVIRVCATGDPQQPDAPPPKIIAYLSDVSALPEQTMSYIKKIPKIDLLVVDMLTNVESFVHFSRLDAMDLVRQLRPVEAVAVGMTCSMGLHDQVNKELAVMEEEGLSFRLAHDGERFPYYSHTTDQKS